MKTTPTRRGTLLRNELQASTDGRQILKNLSVSAGMQPARDISPVWDQAWEQAWPQTWEQTWVAQNYVQSEQEEEAPEYSV
jgi:hypothetical protein